jgi:hypothetical protein
MLGGPMNAVLGPEGVKDLKDAKALIAELKALLERMRHGGAIPGSSPGPVGETAAGAGFVVNIHEETNVTNVAQHNEVAADQRKAGRPTHRSVEFLVGSGR